MLIVILCTASFLFLIVAYSLPVVWFRWHCEVLGTRPGLVVLHRPALEGQEMPSGFLCGLPFYCAIVWTPVGEEGDRLDDAVLLHEMAHWRLNHNCLSFFWQWLLVVQPVVMLGLGLHERSLALILASLSALAVHGLFSEWFFDRMEHEADEFASRKGYADEIKLISLRRSNK